MIRTLSAPLVLLCFFASGACLISTRATPVVVYLDSPRLEESVSLSVAFADGAKPVCIDETQSMDESSRFTPADLAILESSLLSSAQPLFSATSLARPPAVPTLRVQMLNHIIKIVSQNERLAMTEVYVTVSREGKIAATDRFTALTKEATWVKDLKGNLNRAIIARSLGLLSSTLRDVPFNPPSATNHTLVFSHSTDALEYFPDEMGSHITQYPQWDGPVSESVYAARQRVKVRFIGVSDQTPISKLVTIHWRSDVSVEQILVGGNAYEVSRKATSPVYTAPGTIRIGVRFSDGMKLECANMQNTAYGQQCAAYRQIPLTRVEILEAGSLNPGSDVRICKKEKQLSLIADRDNCQ